MPELLQEYWYLILAALLIGIAVAWWIFSASRTTKVEKSDEPAESTGSAKRNQALIDAPPAAMRDEDNLRSAPSSAPGPVSASANADAVAAAPAIADAEAGAAVPAREAMRAVPAQAAKAPAGAADDLRQIKGVGPKLASLLNELGVTSFAQIAAWNDADIDAIDAQLGRFEGRIRRDDWVAQALLLSQNDIAAYEERFGKM